MNDDARAWSRAKQVLESALERTPEERPSFLDRACGGDDDLRLEIESLLTAHDAAENFAERPAIFALDDSATDHPAGDHDDGQGGASLKPGDDLGPYRIAEYLGAGGMGEVYRATDTRLHRSVALKILSHELGDDPDRRQRFEREARAVAALRHPHICVLHDIGQADGVEFLVMEFLDGESLAARLTHGPLPLHQALRYGIEIADALAETHRQGIVHRDLKPGNIMLTAAGAKLLDFGIAKRQPPVARGGPRDASESLTAPSAMLGTLHYMAPEQLEGKEVDARADLFALGTVLYEMVTGKKAFDGDSLAGIVATILERQPAPLKRGPQVPIGLEGLILKCLAKKPDERWQRAGEIVDELGRLAGDAARVGSPKGIASSRSVRTASFVALVVLVGSAVLSRTGLVARMMVYWQPGSQVAQPKTGDVALRLTVGNLRQVTAGEDIEVDPAISPDGRFVAYAGGNARQMRVFIRPLSGNRAIRLSDDDRAFEFQPRWSPDGNEILYVTTEGAFVVSAFGGTPRRVDNSSDAGGMYSSPDKGITGNGITGAAWSPDGRQIAIASGGALSLVPREGAGPHQVLARARDELHQCDWSRDGKWIACASGNAYFAGPGGNFGNNAPSAIVLIPARGGAPVELTDRAVRNQSPAWSHDPGRLFFVSNRQGAGDIYSLEILSNGQPRGEPVRVTTGLGAYSIAFSPEGNHLAYAAYSARANIWSLPIPTKGPVDVSRAIPLTRGNQVIEAMRVSRDGRWLLYDSTLYGSADIFRIPVEGGAAERLTTDPGDEFGPDLSPNGREVAYFSWRTKSRDIFVKPIDGGREQQVTSTPSQESYPEWSPDGRSLIFLDQAVEHGVLRGMFLVRRDDAGRWGAPEPLNFTAGVMLPNGAFLGPLTTADAMEFLAPDRSEHRVLYRPRPHTSDPVAESGRIEADGSGKVVYIKTHDAEGHAEFWSIPVTGGRPTLLVKFDDLSRPSSRADFAVGAGRFFFTIDERQSNIWIADVAER